METESRTSSQTSYKHALRSLRAMNPVQTGIWCRRGRVRLKTAGGRRERTLTCGTRSPVKREGEARAVGPLLGQGSRPAREPRETGLGRDQGLRQAGKFFFFKKISFPNPFSKESLNSVKNKTMHSTKLNMPQHGYKTCFYPLCVSIPYVGF